MQPWPEKNYRRGAWLWRLGDTQTQEENDNLGSSSDTAFIILKIGLFLNMELTDRIEINPEVLVGKPVIKGTRISVELILEELGSGNSMEDLLENYPRLEKADVFAALQYGAWALKQTMVYPATA